MSFWKRKQLHEYAPSELDFERLNILHASLIAKLILVNNELIKRCVVLAVASKEMKNPKEGEMFEKTAKKFRGLGLILTQVLSEELHGEAKSTD